MYSKKAHKQYTNVHVSTVDRGRLLLMLYDGCTKFLKHAKAGLEAKDIPKFARFLSKAQAIISELMLTLDFEKGGDVAKDLDRLYDFMLFYLTEANLEKNVEKLQKVIDLVEIIASAYREVIEGESKRAAESGGTAKSTEEKAKEGEGNVQGGLSVAF
jgi:flagellar protein FliS